MNNPLVSVIIPAYNRANLIRETLDSVFAQTYENWECIVVDDGSTDDSSKVIEHYVNKDARFQYHHRPVDRPKGANTCRNYGFELSKGVYIMFLDSDDICEKYCLLERVFIVTQKPDIDLLIRDTAVLLDDVKQNYTINKDPKNRTRNSYLEMFLEYEIPWTIMGVLYKRTILEKCKFNECLKRFQDVSFGITILLKNEDLKIHRDSKIDNYYRVDSNKIFNNEFVSVVLNSLLDFYNIHTDLLKHKKFKFYFKKFNYKMINEFVIPHFEKNKKESNNIFLWSISSGIYNFEAKVVIICLQLFINLGIFRLKGIGMYRLYKKFNKLSNSY